LIFMEKLKEGTYEIFKVHKFILICM
jgi:hypothetical protein